MLMDFIEKNFDDYNRKARLTPALLVSLPIVLVVIALFPTYVWSGGGFIGLVIWFGTLKFLAQLARHMGKIKEDELYAEWGGKPTTHRLRHRSAYNKVELARWHSKLHELTSLVIPNQIEELDDPDFADQTYDTCTNFLISKTRDHSRFFLIYEENCNYGFRRNLLGLKPIGTVTSFMGVMCLAVQCALMIELFNAVNIWQTSGLAQGFSALNLYNISPLSIACLTINFFLLITLILYVNSGWVKETANAYATRLFESCENLP
jgi:hypothetical protein